MLMTSDDGAAIARFEIQRRAYLGPGGEVRTSLSGFATPPSALIPLYEAMVLNRAFDARAVALQRTGRLGTYAVSLGQEAVSYRRTEILTPVAPLRFRVEPDRDFLSSTIRGGIRTELTIRKDRTPTLLRKLAKAEANTRVARRLLALANALSGLSRKEAAEPPTWTARR